MTLGVALMLTLGGSIAAAVGFWVLSLRLRDAGIVDVLWGYGFAGLALAAFVLADAPGARGALLLGAILLWSLRLGTHLWLRCIGQPEDFRYAQMRAHQGEAFGRRSFLRVFLFQAGVQWLLSLPLQLAFLRPGSAELGAFDYAGLALFALGFGIEATADLQLARFRRDPGNRGQVLDRGLWRYSRHPNYFGECLIAWGLYGIASQTPLGPWLVWSPLLLTFLITRVSGVPYLERGLRRRIPGYADYMRRTPRFVPGRPLPRTVRGVETARASSGTT